MNQFAQRITIDKLHSDEIHAVTIANFYRCARCSDDSGRLRILLRERTFPCDLGAKQFQQEEFSSDLAIEFGVLTEIHLTHSAFANLRTDFVAAENSS